MVTLTKLLTRYCAESAHSNTKTVEQEAADSTPPNPVSAPDSAPSAAKVAHHTKPNDRRGARMDKGSYNEI